MNFLNISIKITLFYYSERELMLARPPVVCIMVSKI